MKRLSSILIFALSLVLLTYSVHALTLEDLINHISSFLTSVSNAISGGILPTLKKPTTTTIPVKLPGCKDLCGDGICQRVVCAAVGCPCPETEESCPQDCRAIPSQNCKDNNGVCILKVAGYGDCPVGYEPSNLVCPYSWITKCCILSRPA